jgi:hypothetical protein
MLGSLRNLVAASCLRFPESIRRLGMSDHPPNKTKHVAKQE